MNFRLLCAVAALTVSTSLLPAAVAQKPFAVETKWTIGGTGGWDYLLADPSAHRLYVTHGTRVEVLDTESGKVVGSIGDLKGTHGIALDPNGKLGYISDGGANEVVVFDRATLAKVTSVAAGTNPDGIIFEPKTRTVWAFNGRSKNATVIDAETKAVVATVALPGKPEFPTVDGTGTVFVNIEDKNEILKLNANSKTVEATWPIGAESPSGMAIDVAGHRLFSVCDGNKMVVLDSKTGKVLATPTIGDGPDAAGYDAKNKLAFASGGDGTLSVVDAGKPGYPTIQTVKTQKGGRTMAFDEGNGKVYVVVAEYGPTPAATAAVPHPRPVATPGSFSVMVIGR